jgi:hypothetical protein
MRGGEGTGDWTEEEIGVIELSLDNLGTPAVKNGC